MSCGVGCRRDSDPVLLWLWRGLEATAPIRPLAWEPPYAAGVAQEMAKREEKRKKKRKILCKHQLPSKNKDDGCFHFFNCAKGFKDVGILTNSVNCLH